MKLSQLHPNILADRAKLGKPVKVTGANGKPGEVTSVDPGREDWDITITWEGGNTSVVWHFQCDHIEVAESGFTPGRWVQDHA